jgi:hypothetical protein
LLFTTWITSVQIFGEKAVQTRSSEIRKGSTAPARAASRIGLRRGRVGPARRGRPRSTGPRAMDPTPGTAPPSTARPLNPRVAHAVAMPCRPSRRPPNGVSAVPAHVAAVPCRAAPHTVALGRLDVRAPPLHLTAGI